MSYRLAKLATLALLAAPVHAGDVDPKAVLGGAIGGGAGAAVGSAMGGREGAIIGGGVGGAAGAAIATTDKPKSKTVVREKVIVEHPGYVEEHVHIPQGIYRLPASAGCGFPIALLDTNPLQEAVGSLSIEFHPVQFSCAGKLE